MLSKAEIDEFLHRGRWAILATAHDGRPYAVPVAYGWDGRSLYVAMAPGRKADALEANPALCLTITEIAADAASWYSVVAMGRAVWLEEDEARRQAFGALRRQHGGARGRRDAERLARARVICLTPAEITGRARTNEIGHDAA